MRRKRKGIIILFMKERLFPSIMNSRDIGGYKTKEGYSEKGVIFRSGSLTGIDEETKNALLSKGITTVIDLRSNKAKTREVDPTSSDSRFVYLPFRLKGGERLPSSRLDVISIYEEMYLARDELKPIFEAVAERQGGVLIHCSAGKDRTGVIISLLQFMAGVSLEDINREYLLSYDEIESHIRHLRELGEIVSPAYYEKDETLLPHIFSLLKARFGSKEAYFAYLGLDSSLMEKIKKKETK